MENRSFPWSLFSFVVMSSHLLSWYLQTGLRFSRAGTAQSVVHALCYLPSTFPTSWVQYSPRSSIYLEVCSYRNGIHVMSRHVSPLTKIVNVMNQAPQPKKLQVHLYHRGSTWKYDPLLPFYSSIRFQCMKDWDAPLVVPSMPFRVDLPHNSIFHISEGSHRHLQRWHVYGRSWSFIELSRFLLLEDMRMMFILMVSLLRRHFGSSYLLEMS